MRSEPGKIAAVLLLSVLAHGVVFAAFSWVPLPSWVSKISELPAVAEEESSPLEVTLISVTPAPQTGRLALDPEEQASGDLTLTQAARETVQHYGKAVGSAIGNRFERLRKTWPEALAPGEVRIQFILRADGSTSSIKVLSNTAGPATAACAEAAVKAARIPPIPAERLVQVPGGRLQIVYSFNVYPQ